MDVLDALEEIRDWNARNAQGEATVTHYMELAGNAQGEATACDTLHGVSQGHSR